MTLTALGALLPLVALLVPGLAQPRAGKDQIAVRDAWVRVSSAARTVSSGYLVVENRASTPLALVRVEVEGVGNAELHAVVEENGRTTMKAIARLPVPPRGSAALAPGGTHLMLTEITRPLRLGTTLRMTLTFDNRQTRTVRAIVRPLDAMSAK